LVTIPTFLGYDENYIYFIIHIHTFTTAEILVQIGPVLAEVFVRICQFCPVVAKFSQTPFLISKVTGPVVTIFLHNVEALVPLLMHAFPWRDFARNW